ncbi:MAG: winged helix-turn-helix domain-containing protein [Symbiobacteriaceae bacterium]|nr:winged helix-turn-helix domain-containing protein [Symbiobacteriaceae bacterium]
MSAVLTVKTLGSFSVRLGNTMISSDSARSQKVWRIFKRLITNRHKTVPIEALIETLWENDEPLDPQKSLYTLMSRLRKLLNADGEERNCILYQHNSYQWNPQIPINLDVADFENFIKQAETLHTDQEKMPLLKQALDLYDGDYLAESATEMWVIPITNYYKRLYLRSVIDLCDIYDRQGMMDEIIQLCGQALANEPFEEGLHERLIRTLFLNGETATAQQHYRRFIDLVHREFGAEPSEEFRAQFRGLWEHEAHQYDLEGIKRKLDGEITRSGAYFCTADIFNQIYLFDKRADERMKFPVFLALITIPIDHMDAQDSADMRFLKGAMITLRQILMRTLRRGDIVSQYSKNQFLLMLSAYHPKDAETALSRVKRMFISEYKDMEVEFQFSVAQIGNI